MVPVFTVIALHPRFLQIIVVLLLDELLLRELLPFNVDITLNRVVTRVTPRISSNFAHDARHVVEHLSSLDACATTVTVQRRRFKRQPLNAACLARTLGRFRNRALGFLLELTSARLTLTLNLFLIRQPQRGEVRTNLLRRETLHQRRSFSARFALLAKTTRALHHELTARRIIVKLHALVAMRHLHLSVLSLLEHGIANRAAHRTAGILARLVMLQQLARRNATRVVA